MRPKTREEFIQRVEAVLGEPVQPDSFHERTGLDTDLVASFILDTGLTYQQLTALSVAMGTERINLEPAEQGHRYSSWTYDSGTPAKVVFLWSKE